MHHIFKHTKTFFVTGLITLVLFFALFYASSLVVDAVWNNLARMEGDDIKVILETEGQQILREARNSGELNSIRDYDRFLQVLKQSYLPEGTHIAFYSSDGITLGSSFTDEEQKKLTAAYFNIGSDFLTGREREGEVILGGQEYFLQNVALEGTEGLAAGALIFTETNYSTRSLAIAALLALGFVLTFYFIEKRRTGEKLIRRHHWAGFAVFLAVLLAGFISAQYGLHNSAIKINKAPFTIYNSTLRLTPNYDIYTVGEQQKVAIELESGGEAINAAGVYLSFDPQLMRVEEIVTENSFCREDLFIEREINNEDGEVRIACGLPTPGFEGVRGIVAELLFTPLQDGYAGVSFTDETTILANDGLGTDVLRFAENGGYQALEGGGSSEGTPPTPFVFSDTHSNRERKYNQKVVRFSWPDAGDFNYIYEFDQNPATIPTGETSTQENNLSFTAGSDGTYWLHVAARSGNITGPVVHYPVHIDTTPPEAPVIRASSQNINVNEVVRFEFDNNGGEDLQPNFYLKIDDGTFVPTTQRVFMPFFEPGTHRITVRIFDTAGNFSDSAVDITVEGGNFWNRWWRVVDFRNIFQ